MTHLSRHKRLAVRLAAFLAALAASVEAMPLQEDALQASSAAREALIEAALPGRCKFVKYLVLRRWHMLDRHLVPGVWTGRMLAVGWGARLWAAKLCKIPAVHAQSVPDAESKAERRHRADVLLFLYVFVTSSSYGAWHGASWCIMVHRATSVSSGFLHRSLQNLGHGAHHY